MFLHCFFRREKMYRKIRHNGPGAALVLAGLLVFAACEQPESDPTGQIEITGIPSIVDNGKGSYKVFVQLSKGTNAEDGYVAKGDALIDGQNSVIMALKDDKNKPWSGAGTFYIAVVLSPEAVDTWEDIDVYANQIVFSSTNQSFVWKKNLMYLNTYSPDRVKQIYDGGDSGKPGIICAPESGINYPGKP
jgi:hypothetical protein